MPKSLNLWQRLSLLFAALLLTCFGLAASLQMIQSVRYSQQIEQRLLHRLADHIAVSVQTMGVHGLDRQKLSAFVDRLQITNPGVELYVLDPDGRVEMRYPDTHLMQRPQVDLKPIQTFLAETDALVLGDDPLSPTGSKAFSAARYPRAPGEPGYLYAVLQGSAYDMAAAQTGWDNAVRIALWSIGLITPFGLLAGLAAFRWVTRPLTQLTLEVEQIERRGRRDGRDDASASAPVASASGDEISILRDAFKRLVTTNNEQWDRLSHQDRQRRELIASLSHDLRTPLASLHGYLETLLMNSAQLDVDNRNRHLHSALAQSRSVGRLAGELLELAQMELGMVKPKPERFSLIELTQDVIQKMELSALSRNQRIAFDVQPGVADVCADIGMIERVLTNLLGNAIKHSPSHTHIWVSVQPVGARVSVEVTDSGAGIDPARRPGLFLWPSERTDHELGRRSHGLGLAIVRQILQLHGGDVVLNDRAGNGCSFVFSLNAHSSHTADVKGAATVVGDGSGV